MRQLALAFSCLTLMAPSAFAEASCSLDRIDLRWNAGTESFAVEVADDGEERALGLMNRTEMDMARGMLFVYESPRRVGFWMKNTLIPLDMIFADATGTVTKVHAMAVPLDETPIDGGENVQFVLEINGGLAAKLGIAPGAEMRHPAIGNSAAWACQ